jgi:thymidine kinase
MTITPAVKKGRLEVVCGSMFSGKTEELMSRLKRAEYARQRVLSLKHQLDNRKSMTCIVSHDGRARAAYPIDNCTMSVQTIVDLADQYDVIGIDEVQFFPEEIVAVVAKLVDLGKRVIVAGLDLDFRGEPFGAMPYLLSIADEVMKLKAICVVCTKDAHHTQRLVNGEPARYNDPIILIGAQDFYEARCRDCFAIDQAPLIVQQAKQTTAQV